MTKKGINMTTVKYQNRALILNILKNYGACSRVDIAKALGLTPAAITILTNEMLDEGIIIEAGQLEEKNKKSGRKKILIDINYSYKYIIGINIERDYINIGISDLSGRPVSKHVMQVDKSSEAEALLKSIANICINMLWQEGILKENILGIGVGIIGKVNKASGISEHAYGLWNEQINIKAILEAALGIKVVVDNNVRALALSELEMHVEKPSNLLFIKHGPGIGSAIAINGDIYYGSTNSAGEIGHTSNSLEGDQCKCGKKGCLETRVSHKALIGRASAVFSKQNTPALFRLCEGISDNITIDKLYEAAALKDEHISVLIKEAFIDIAIAIANSISMYDPDMVILYGKAFKYEFVIKEISSALNKLCGSNYSDKLISISRIADVGSFMGGIALALKEFFFSIGKI